MATDPKQQLATLLAGKFSPASLQSFSKGLRVLYEGNHKPSTGQLWALFKTKVGKHDQFKTMLEQHCNKDFPALLEAAILRQTEENSLKLIEEEEREKSKPASSSQNTKLQKKPPAKSSESPAGSAKSEAPVSALSSTGSIPATQPSASSSDTTASVPPSTTIATASATIDTLEPLVHKLEGLLQSFTTAVQEAKLTHELLRSSLEEGKKQRELLEKAMEEGRRLREEQMREMALLEKLMNDAQREQKKSKKRDEKRREALFSLVEAMMQEDVEDDGEEEKEPAAMGSAEQTASQPEKVEDEGFSTARSRRGKPIGRCACRFINNASAMKGVSSIAVALLILYFAAVVECLFNPMWEQNFLNGKPADGKSEVLDPKKYVGNLKGILPKTKIDVSRIAEATAAYLEKQKKSSRLKDEL